MARAREVTVDLDGQVLSLRFDFNAIATIEKMTGRNVLEGLASPSGTDLRAIVYACAAASDEAKGKEPRLTVTQVGALMEPGNVEKLSAALNELTGGEKAAAQEEAGDKDPPEAQVKAVS